MEASKHWDASTKDKVVQAYAGGANIKELSTIFEVSVRTIYRWVARYDSTGTTRPKVDNRGRPPKIGNVEGERLFKMLEEGASNYGFENDLWDTKRLQIICKKQFGIEISRVGIWGFLKRFDKSFKKVQKRYYETDVAQQEKWKRTVLARIKKIIKLHRAILYFEDESNIQLSPEMGKSWGDIGKTITHKVTGNRGSISAISAISNDGRLLFNVFDGAKRFRSDDIIRFLGQMLAYHKRRHLVVVMDNAACHTSKRTRDFIDSQKRLHVFFLPPRSPDFNPDEQIWGHLKNHELKSHQESTIDGLKKLVKKKMKKLSLDTEKLKRIFKLCQNHALYT